jgi:hypothetical protein
VTTDFALALNMVADDPSLTFQAAEEVTRVDELAARVDAAFERGRAFGAGVGFFDGYDACMRDLRETLLVDFAMPPAAVEMYVTAVRARGAAR